MVTYGLGKAGVGLGFGVGVILAVGVTFEVGEGLIVAEGVEVAEVGDGVSTGALVGGRADNLTVMISL
jgi:hypothetical protein